ncbi:MAG: hypothetical protein IPF81_09270 [Bacteroidetes bacterium]|nr:hypothetical protein [Bacteroidota bacterium]
MREDALLRRIETLKNEFTHNEPLFRYLKSYFALHRNMGARDRRETREWIFNYFRLGKSLPQLEFPVRLAIANFLCSENSSPSLIYLLSKTPDLRIEDLGLPLEEKIEIVKNIFQLSRRRIFFP